MNDDYLWSGRGKPDPDVERLEELLRGFRHEPTGWTAGEHARAPRKHRGRALAWSGLAAAVLIAAIVGSWWFSRGSRDGWEVATLAGRPTIGGKGVREGTHLPLGARLATDAGSRASLRIGVIGEAEIGPGSSVRLVRADSTDNRLALERGTLSARIWAPPRRFYVETPSATAVDLGCAYTLEVDAAGAGLLRVTLGWVAFDDHGRESFVPAGAACRTRPGAGPGTPWYEDARTPFTEALESLDARPNHREALAIVLAEARPRDALTLWHLLSRLGGDERGLVFDRLAAIVPLPASVTRAGIVAGDRAMLDAAWDSLGLGVTTWWRSWKGPGPPEISDARSRSPLSPRLVPRAAGSKPRREQGHEPS
jgi:ferric-dicitrate binding protein FerR (iron transport regulator)